jgi:hypothetical protein
MLRSTCGTKAIAPLEKRKRPADWPLRWPISRSQRESESGRQLRRELCGDWQRFIGEHGHLRGFAQKRHFAQKLDCQNGFCTKTPAIP